ncbi:hypothetical protein [Arenimonas oryziterrae]|uniref:Uncharacterized protein n=1 Tax=Arenimonas oryziterrae DSM 21050 = YC6267 TaxID=1121015 RepID=A0A091AZZ1_9GAMM|nr:hypothetical protein [Arenimonas oryziterrae]KFN44872.1 hypothetical protein N789_02315 [Arenimonas oryziterrae DSM 21050 = YC6267]
MKNLALPALSVMFLCLGSCASTSGKSQQDHVAEQQRIAQFVGARKDESVLYFAKDVSTDGAQTIYYQISLVRQPARHEGTVCFFHSRTFMVDVFGKNGLRIVYEPLDREITFVSAPDRDECLPEDVSRDAAAISIESLMPVIPQAKAAARHWLESGPLLGDVCRRWVDPSVGTLPTSEFRISEIGEVGPGGVFVELFHPKVSGIVRMRFRRDGAGLDLVETICPR